MRAGACLLLLALGCAHPAPPPPGTTLERLSSLRAVSQAASARGRPRVVHFWALWCASCMEELPRQVTFATRLRAAGVDVLFVDLDGFDREDRVRTHLEVLGAFQVAEQAMLDTGLDAALVTRQFSEEWGGSLPATFARSADGRTVAQVLGPASEAELERAFAAVSGQSPPAAPLESGEKQ